MARELMHVVFHSKFVTWRKNRCSFPANAAATYSPLARDTSTFPAEAEYFVPHIERGTLGRH